MSKRKSRMFPGGSVGRNLREMRNKMEHSLIMLSMLPKDLQQVTQYCTSESDHADLQPKLNKVAESIRAIVGEQCCNSYYSEFQALHEKSLKITWSVQKQKKELIEQHLALMVRFIETISQPVFKAIVELSQPLQSLQKLTKAMQQDLGAGLELIAQAPRRCQSEMINRRYSGGYVERINTFKTDLERALTGVLPLLVNDLWKYISELSTDPELLEFKGKIEARIKDIDNQLKKDKWVALVGGDDERIKILCNVLDVLEGYFCYGHDLKLSKYNTDQVLALNEIEEKYRKVVVSTIVNEMKKYIKSSDGAFEVEKLTAFSQALRATVDGHAATPASSLVKTVDVNKFIEAQVKTIYSESQFSEYLQEFFPGVKPRLLTAQAVYVIRSLVRTQSTAEQDSEPVPDFKRWVRCYLSSHNSRMFQDFKASKKEDSITHNHIFFYRFVCEQLNTSIKITSFTPKKINLSDGSEVLFDATVSYMHLLAFHQSKGGAHTYFQFNDLLGIFRISVSDDLGVAQKMQLFAELIHCYCQVDIKKTLTLAKDALLQHDQRFHALLATDSAEVANWCQHSLIKKILSEMMYRAYSMPYTVIDPLKDVNMLLCQYIDRSQGENASRYGISLTIETLSQMMRQIIVPLKYKDRFLEFAALLRYMHEVENQCVDSDAEDAQAQLDAKDVHYKMCNSYYDLIARGGDIPRKMTQKMTMFLQNLIMVSDYRNSPLNNKVAALRYRYPIQQQLNAMKDINGADQAEEVQRKLEQLCRNLAGFDAAITVEFQPGITDDLNRQVKVVFNEHGLIENDASEPSVIAVANQYLANIEALDQAVSQKNADICKAQLANLGNRPLSERLREGAQALIRASTSASTPSEDNSHDAAANKRLQDIKEVICKAAADYSGQDKLNFSAYCAELSTILLQVTGQVELNSIAQHFVQHRPVSVYEPFSTDSDCPQAAPIQHSNLDQASIDKLACRGSGRFSSYRYGGKTISRRYYMLLWMLQQKGDLLSPGLTDSILGDEATDEANTEQADQHNCITSNLNDQLQRSCSIFGLFRSVNTARQQRIFSQACSPSA